MAGTILYDGVLPETDNRFSATTGKVQLNLDQDPDAQVHVKTVTGRIYCDFKLANQKRGGSFTGDHLSVCNKCQALRLPARAAGRLSSAWHFRTCIEHKPINMVSISFTYPAIEKTDKNLCLSNAEAAKEVRIVVENILRHHPNPFHVTGKADFYLEVDKLLEREGEISIARHFFALGRIASLIFATHTQIHVTNETPGFDTSFPLRFRIFSDGLYIIAGSEAYRQAIEKRVASICGRQPDDLLDRLAQHAFSDHLPRKRLFAEIFLYMPETYEVFSLKTARGKIEFVLQDSEGHQSTVELSETWPKGYADCVETVID